MTQLTVFGTLTTLGPFHLAHAGMSAEIDQNGRVRKLSAGTAKLPCTPTYKVPFPLSGDLAIGFDGTVRAVAEVPCLPGTSIRGKLRRVIAKRVKRHFVATGQLLSREAYHCIQCGAFSGDGIKANLTTSAEVIAAKEHLFTGIFGGGPRLFRSNLRTHDSYLYCAETEATNVQPVVPETPALIRAYQATFAHPFIRRDDLLDFLDPIAPDVIENYAEAFESWQNTVLVTQERKALDRNAALEARAAKKRGEIVEKPDAGASSEKQKKVMLKGQSALEAVMPGVNFGFRIDIRGDDAQCGLVLAGIVDMIKEENFGGKCASGYGRMGAHLRVMNEQGEEFPFLDYDGRTLLVGTQIKAYSEALEGGLAQLTSASFEAIYNPKTDASPRKGKGDDHEDDEA